MVDKIDFSQIPKERHDDYESSFESDNERKAHKNSFAGLVKEGKKKEKVAHKRLLEDELVKEEGRLHRIKAVSLDAFSRHKEYINNYLLYYGGSKKDFQRDTSKDKTDIDIIRENHQFLWEEEEEEQSWEKRLAKKYYDKLFKEYCIADLSRYKENKIGMRWRIEKEVVDGKGQFVCGNKKCPEMEGLRSWEVNFGYVEQGEKKNALVKLRLCPDCSYKLNYHHKRKEVVNRSKQKSEPSPKPGEKASKKKRTSDDRLEFEDPGTSSSKSVRDRGGQAKEDEHRSEEEQIWTKPVSLEEDKSREDEFDDYFADMLL